MMNPPTNNVDVRLARMEERQKAEAQRAIEKEGDQKERIDNMEAGFNKRLDNLGHQMQAAALLLGGAVFNFVLERVNFSSTSIVWWPVLKLWEVF